VFMAEFKSGRPADENQDDILLVVLVLVLY
jgi:hypothetical protein